MIVLTRIPRCCGEFVEVDEAPVFISKFCSLYELASDGGIVTEPAKNARTEKIGDP
jgi:hypothetical protein